MPIDLPAAAAFITTHARVLDRRRFAVRFEGADPDGALAALDAYRNADVGYGWALEPDLRGPESQPGAALHAFEVFEDVAPATSPRAMELCDWLASASLADGGLPFVLPPGRQRDDGGWDFDHVPHSPAAVLDWRGHATVHALAILDANGRVPAASG
jgi:hypothetical protein